MKNLIIAFVVASSGLAAADDSITLHQAPSKVGDKSTEEKTETSSLNVDANGTKVAVVSEHKEKKTIEVVKVTDGVVTEAKYSYATFTATETVNGKDKSKPIAAIAGKSYKLTAGSPVGVAAASGKAADDEIELVRKTERRFGKPDKFGKVLDGKSFAKDKAVTIPAAEAADAFGDDPEMKAASLTFTYRGMSGAVASFDIALEMDGDKDGMHLVAKLAGKVLIDPKSLAMGTLDVKGSLTGTGKVKFDGTMSIHEATTK